MSRVRQLRRGLPLSRRQSRVHGCQSTTVQETASSCQVPQTWDAGSFFGSHASTSSSRPRRSDAAVAGQYYQRDLPTAQIPFSSMQGRDMFRHALLEGNMENYFYLAEQFHTQDEPTYCGLTTLAMSLNALRIDPMQTWKGVWRWHSESMLGCCALPENVRTEGISYDTFARLAVCQGAHVVSRRAPEASGLEAFEAHFRSTIRAVCQSSERQVLVLCYCRQSLGQTGAGHFSPVGGYHEPSDSVLVLDVARFKYPPHWVPLRRLVQAMHEVDPDTGRPRGFLHLGMPEMVADGELRLLSVPHMPAAAGRKLSQALSKAFAKPCPFELMMVNEGFEAVHVATMRRWLQVAATIEPNVIRQLLQIGDEPSWRQVLHTLEDVHHFSEFCKAYTTLVARCNLRGGFAGSFPPLRFESFSARAAQDGQLSLSNCGEFWVLLLMLLPEHLRASLSRGFASSRLDVESFAQSLDKTWAMLFDAVRASLEELLPPPVSDACARTFFFPDSAPDSAGMFELSCS